MSTQSRKEVNGSKGQLFTNGRLISYAYLGYIDVAVDSFPHESPRISLNVLCLLCV